MSDDRAVTELFDWLEREKIAIDLLINNAGLGDVGPFATSELQRVKEMLAVNVTALTLLTRLLLPGMIARKRGAILNVSSTAGFLPIAGFAVYAATKAYVTSFSEAIRAELHGTGVTVTSLCPGPVPHGVHPSRGASRRQTRPKLRNSFTSPPKKPRAPDSPRSSRDKPLVIPGVIMKLGMFLVRIMPLSILRLASRLSAKV